MCDCSNNGNNNNNNNTDQFCGSWTPKAPMITPRELFAATSGPDKTGTSPTDVDSDPRVYVIGGNGPQGEPLQSCEKYNPNDDTWVEISPLPEPVGNCNGSFVPDYGKSKNEVLGYIYVMGDNKARLYRYNIKQDLWDVFPVPFSVSNASLQYLDDIGGPLSELLQAITGTSFPPCSDGKTLWIVGGNGTETETWYINLATNGTIDGDWIRGPDLPLKRVNPVVGRTFWRDTGITSYGVSNCATILVCGGYRPDGSIDDQIQLLTRYECNWQWIIPTDNPTNFPNTALKLAYPVADGAFGTEQWPETLVTGGRPLVFGGNPDLLNGGSVQYSQLRFTRGRYRPYPKNDKYWNLTTSMPGQRTNFRAPPLSQENSSVFGGRRVSRFLCIGGRNPYGLVTDKTQLFELPTPSPFLICSAPNNQKCNCSKHRTKEKRSKHRHERKHRCDNI